MNSANNDLDAATPAPVPAAVGAEFWLAEHYPVNASAFEQYPYKHWRDEEPAKAIAAVEHSLVKWRGLRPEVLQRHGLRLNSVKDVVDDLGEVLIIDGASCSLCARYACRVCPIKSAMGRPCAGARDYEFDVYIDKGDPEPMIALLEHTLEHVKKEFGV